MDIKAQIEAIEATVSTSGWRELKKYFRNKQTDYLRLLADTPLTTEQGLKNAMSYQAMYHAIDAFYEDVKDIRANLEDQANKEKGGEA
uniref:Uncharacterized protein n=1 Tax=viral metagenome TaxID=1070528 RepID=A0A6H1ZC62_9ZZZZ